MPDACPAASPPEGERPAEGAECYSNADCADGEICRHPNGLCLGAGHCAEVEDCAPDTGRERCGCDGRTYRSKCAAEQAGVRVSRIAAGCGELPDYSDRCDSKADCPESSMGECIDGVCRPKVVHIPCGRDEQCPADRSRCCPLTGTCVDPDCEVCCSEPPEGTFFPCRSDADCKMFSSFCAGPGCGPGGGCALNPGGCKGTFEPVCGCDGMSYTNACWAHRHRVRIAHEGECEEGS